MMGGHGWRQWSLAILLSGGAMAETRLAVLPLRFEANRGQAEAGARFVSGGAGYRLLLTETGSVVELSDGKRAARVTTTLRGARRGTLEGIERLETRTNYLRGGAERWITDVPSWARVRYGGVYPGIDLIFYGAGRALEYDFVVAAGADPGAIELEVSRDARARLTENGDLELATAAGAVYWRRPEIYQMADGGRRKVAGRFALSRRRVSFELGEYDRGRELVIDPTLSFSTYLGGNDNDLTARMVTDAAGNIYVVGATASVNLPFTAGAFQPTFQGGSAAFTITGDAFVAKIDATGTKAVYVTYLGGRQDDAGLGIAVDSAGNAYVTGNTTSPDFPVKNAFQSTYAGPAVPHGFSLPNAQNPGGDAFVTKLNAAGNALVYSTFLGGSSDERGVAIAVDKAGNAYVAGMTLSTNFPFSAAAYQKTMKGTGGSPNLCDNCGQDFSSGDVFVAKFNADGTRAWATLLGGSMDDAPSSVLAAADGSVWVAGATLSPDFPVTTATAYQKTYGGKYSGQIIQNVGDGFIAHLSADGASLQYATYLGGSGDDAILGMTMDAQGAIYVTGFTSSANFPHTSGTFHGPSTVSKRVFVWGDVFVAKFNFAAANPLVFSTLLGGSDDEMGVGIALDAAGDIFVTGATASTDFPLVDPYQKTFGAGGAQSAGHAFLTELDPTGTKILYSTLLGGSSTDMSFAVSVDGTGNVVLAGHTSSTDFPTVAPLQKSFGGGRDSNSVQGDAFIARFSGFAAAAGPAVLSLTGTASPASVAEGATFSYTFTVTNAGPGAAANVKLTAMFGGGAVQITGAAITAGTCGSPAATVQCSIASLGQGATAVLTIQGVGQAVGTAQVSAGVAWDGGTPQALVGTITVAPPAGGLQFAAPVSQKTASGAPAAMAFASPNLFVLTANVEIFQNQPNPPARVNLAAQTPLTLAAPPVALAAPDLNGDQTADLVVLDNGGNVTTYLAGGGGYAVAQSFAAMTNPAGMTTVNLNGDGAPDLAVIGDGGVALFTANGDGTYTPGATFDIAGRQAKLLAVAAGSFTGAGLDDLVLADAGGNVWLLPSDGAGGFGTPTMAQAGSNPVALAVGDFNGDGNLDVAAANSGSGDVSLLPGDGAGNLGAAANVAVGAAPTALAAADFNGDGNLDLAVAVSGQNTLCVLRGDGAGNFQAAQYVVGTTPVALAVGDVDGDGKADIMAGNRGSRDISVLVNGN